MYSAMIYVINNFESLFDIKVIDTDAPSHLHRTPEQILDAGALEKKKLYIKRQWKIGEVHLLLL